MVATFNPEDFILAKGHERTDMQCVQDLPHGQKTPKICIPRAADFVSAERGGHKFRCKLSKGFNSSY